ncbi:hypothetical protein MSG28_008254 [Choristoneura fumiferana]|uniref:Uncharacterized protein n=1 Tax=Choristoneura fumiferana TaxID=7141 RepID=A0ACC0JAR7_CHOFU|nr:hypothetical protein MSG28_008254 [Choristoneura fumiferana]
MAEVDRHAGGGLVSEGSLRERDCWRCCGFPLRALVGALLLLAAGGHNPDTSVRVATLGALGVARSVRRARVTGDVAPRARRAQTLPAPARRARCRRAGHATRRRRSTRAQQVSALDMTDPASVATLGALGVARSVRRARVTGDVAPRARRAQTLPAPARRARCRRAGHATRRRRSTRAQQVSALDMTDPASVATLGALGVARSVRRARYWLFKEQRSVNRTRDSYSRDMVEPIEMELEALFAEGAATTPAGCAPPALLRPAARAAYCVALMTRLHDKSPLVLDAPPVELPAMPCEQSVRVAAQAAVDCGDHELARMVLDFLVKTAVKRKSVCGGLCAGAARDCLPRLLRAHDYLFATALHTVAELHQVEPLQPAADTLKFLSLQGWRPSTGEARAVLEDWSQRCPQLLQYLLHGVSYTPYDGLSLEAQLTVGAWLCQLPAPTPEWAWSALTRLRVHRSSWRLPLDAPPPSPPSGLFAEAYAVLSSSWGHSVPEICEYGVSALCRVAGERATVAAHALPLVMAAMAASPESVSLTPQFGKLIVSLLAPAQSLVQWAWGCRAAAPELLLRRMLLQLQTSPHRDAVASAWLHGLCDPRLPGPRLRARDAALLASRRTRTLQASTMTRYKDPEGFQEAPKLEFLYHLLRHVQHAPLSVEVALRATHAERELSTQLYAKLLHALDAQRASNLRIHVDNALKLIGSSTVSEDLVIYQTAAALLAAPAAHPATLALWRLLMHLYLHTATTSTMPIGLLFFSGLIKSRTLAQLKKRLQEHIVYHHNQAEACKSLLNTRPEPKPDTSSAGTPDTVPVTGMLPPTSISKFTGTDSDSCDSDVIDESDDEIDERPDDNSASESEERRRVNFNMMQYHEGAEKMLREYSCWLDAGERLRASPHHADIARFIPDPNREPLLTPTNCPPGSKHGVGGAARVSAAAPSPEDDDLRPPRHPSAPAPPPTPLQTAVKWILRIRDRSHRRSQAPVITSPVDDVNFSNQRQLYCLVDKHLAEIEAFASSTAEMFPIRTGPAWELWPKPSCSERRPVPSSGTQWSSDVSSVANLDTKLWQLVGALRVRVPLAPVARSCANKCAPVTLSLQVHAHAHAAAPTSARPSRSHYRYTHTHTQLRQQVRARHALTTGTRTRTRSCANKCAPVTLSLQGFHEWRISEGATAGVKHNRAAARKAIAALCRARPQQARTVAALTTIARRLRSQEAAIGVAERAWACAGALPECPPAAAALTALVEDLADRWFACDDEAVSALVGRWCAGTAPAQHALCGPLLARAGRGRRVRVYAALLRALPAAARRAPPRAFSQLSKMDVSQWEGDEAQRGEALAALTAAALAWGRDPDPQLHMLLELIGVHLVALTNATQLPLVVVHATRAAAAGRAPPALLASVARAAACAAQLPFDQCGPRDARGGSGRAPPALLASVARAAACAAQLPFDQVVVHATRAAAAGRAPPAPARERRARRRLRRAAALRPGVTLYCTTSADLYTSTTQLPLVWSTRRARRQRAGRRPPCSRASRAPPPAPRSCPSTSVVHATRAAAAGRAPPALLASVARAAACAAQLPFDQLGNLLRELGVIWWEARSVAGDAPWHAAYAPHVAALQHALLRAFVATACMLSYTPERVSWYAWPALQESWAAWVSPHPALPPLLPARGAPHHPAMLKRFVDCIHQIMLDCPDCEEHLLSQVWEWAVRTHLNVTSVTGCHDSRVQLADLLAELSALPWCDHQWLTGNCLHAALQVTAVILYCVTREYNLFILENQQLIT